MVWIRTRFFIGLEDFKVFTPFSSKKRKEKKVFTPLIKDEIRVCDSYPIRIEKRNAKRDEESQNRDQLIPNQSCAIMYLIDDRRALWDFLDRRALWDFYTFLVSGFQRESDIVFVGYVLGYLFKFCCGLFSRAENYFIFYQGLWAEKCKRFSTKLVCFFFFFFTFISRVF